MQKSEITNRHGGMAAAPGVVTFVDMVRVTRGTARTAIPTMNGGYGMNTQSKRTANHHIGERPTPRVRSRQAQKCCFTLFNE
jgi:hypothetical protein